MISESKLSHLTVIILTFNSQDSLEQVIQSVGELAMRILVVDSYSQDNTLMIARRMMCEVVQHEFENYATQRNWAQNYANLGEKDWVLHLDSDEIVTPELAQNIRHALLFLQHGIFGYRIRRITYFMGQPIRWGHTNPNWHLRLFLSSHGYCENRQYDQHFIVQETSQKLSGYILDMQAVSLERWIQSHNRWSTAEAAENYQKHDLEKQLPAHIFSRDIRERKRWWKNKIYYACPLLLRAFVLFFYSYIVRLGFLDGKIGLIYHVLQAFWFRFLVDAKIIEKKIDTKKSFLE